MGLFRGYRAAYAKARQEIRHAWQQGLKKPYSILRST